MQTTPSAFQTLLLFVKDLILILRFISERTNLYLLVREIQYAAKEVWLNVETLATMVFLLRNMYDLIQREPPTCWMSVLSKRTYPQVILLAPCFANGFHCGTTGCLSTLVGSAVQRNNDRADAPEFFTSLSGKMCKYRNGRRRMLLKSD